VSTPRRQPARIVAPPPAEAPRKARREPLTYVVEVEQPAESDPKVAAQVLAFLRARLR
jgi:hypothetical protein